MRPTYRDWILFLTQVNKADPKEFHLSRVEIWAWAMVIWLLSGFISQTELDQEIAEEMKRMKLGIRQTSAGNLLSVVPKDPTGNSPQAK